MRAQLADQNHTHPLAGLATAAAVASAAALLSPALARAGITTSPMVLALLLGLGLAPRVRHRRFTPGLVCASQTLLRAGVALLGCRLGLDQLSALSTTNWLGLLAGVTITLASVRWLARRLQLSDELAWLLAAGHAICGAAAVAATDAIVRSKPREVATAIAMVTLFGTLSMVLLPGLCRWFDCPPTTAGFLAGAALHEVAQAVAAGYACGDASGEIATLVKLARVTLLLPVTLLLVALRPRNHGRASMPWFVLAFAACAVIGHWLPQTALMCTRATSAALLTTAMAALGLRTSLLELRTAGARVWWVALAATTLVTALAAAQAAWLQ